MIYNRKPEFSDFKDQHTLHQDFSMATNISTIIAQLPQYLQEQVPRYDETLQPNIYAAIGVSLALVYLSVGLRIYGRHLQGLNLWWDDYTSIIALVRYLHPKSALTAGDLDLKMISFQFFTTVSSSVLLYLTYLGFGRHQIFLAVEHTDQIGTFLRTNIASNALYFPSVCFSKLAILFQYRRLFPSNRFKWVLNAVGVGTTVYCIISMSVLTALCLPIQVPTLENPLVQPLACSNLTYMLTWICSINSGFDTIILLLPMHNVWRLNTTVRRKLQLTFLFLFGSFVVAISILRTWYLTHLDFNDFTWTGGSLGNMWTEVEGCMAIIVGCLPAMMPVFRGKGFGRKKSTFKPQVNINLATFGSGGKKKSIDPSASIQTMVNGTAIDNGYYTKLPNQVNQENQARFYYQGDDRWQERV